MFCNSRRGFVLNITFKGQSLDNQINLQRKITMFSMFSKINKLERKIAAGERKIELLFIKEKKIPNYIYSLLENSYGKMDLESEK